MFMIKPELKWIAVLLAVATFSGEMQASKMKSINFDWFMLRTPQMAPA